MKRSPTGLPISSSNPARIGSGSSMQWALSLAESRVAALTRSRTSRHSGDLIPIHWLSWERPADGVVLDRTSPQVGLQTRSGDVGLCIGGYSANGVGRKPLSSSTRTECVNGLSRLSP